MKKSKLLLCLFAGLFSVGTAFAATKCPQAYMDEIDGYGDGGTSNTYYLGGGSSDLTTCIKDTTEIKVALNFSSNAKGGPLQTIQLLNNATNMLSNYEHIWGITPENGLKMAIVAHYQGASYLVNNAAKKADGSPVWPTGNPEANRIANLISKGVHVYMCQTSMRANGWKTADLLPGVEMVPAGVIALTDFAQTGWAVITP